mmetsp:Transcript_15550/g.50776  ORF Transcript_15550/g.50776 Transcript_15550/m.50776 type:complete len:252 (+) Transcript_15550:421-1176(+)
MGGEHVVFGADVAQASGLRRVNRLGRRHRRTLRRRRRRRAGRQDRLPPSGRPARRPGARPARMASVDVGQDGSRPTHADAVDHLRTLDQRLPPERSLRRRALVLDAEQAWPGSSGRAVEGQDTRRQDVGRGDGGGCSGGTGAGGFRGSGRLFHPEEGAFELARLEIEEGGERRVEPLVEFGGFGRVLVRKDDHSASPILVRQAVGGGNHSHHRVHVSEAGLEQVLDHHAPGEVAGVHREHVRLRPQRRRLG